MFRWASNIVLATLRRDSDERGETAGIAGVSGRAPKIATKKAALTVQLLSELPLSEWVDRRCGMCCARHAATDTSPDVSVHFR